MATIITVGGTELSGPEGESDQNTYQSFSVEIPLSPTGIAPSATIRTHSYIPIDANDAVTITIDGTTIFGGETTSAGEKSEVGGRRVEAEHAATTLFGEAVDVSLSSPTDEQVFQAALDNSNSGGSFTLDYAGSATSLGNDYDAENREVKQVFRDMMDRTSRVWWVDPAGTTIHVAPSGDRGTWQAIDTRSDGATVTKFNEGSRDSVRNDVTVVGTGAEKVTGTATDATSINTYGRRSDEVNVEYITDAGEAGDMADELLIPEPLASGKLLVGTNVGDVTQPLANYTIDLADVPKDIDATNLVVEKQTIEQGRATLQVGEGSGVSLSNVNRSAKSRDDLTEGGSVYNTDRIADDAIETEKLVDTAVIEDKLDDLSVSLEKVQDGAIDTVKITDDAIESPKIRAGNVTAQKLDASIARAERLLAGEIEALDIATNTLTANEIDTLDLDTGQLSILDSGEGLEFNATGGIVVIEPTSGGGAGIGSASNRMGLSFFDNAQMNLLNTDLLAPQDPPLGDVGFELGNENLDHVYIRPSADDTNYVGTSSNAFREMHAHNFVTASPDPIDAVDCDGLCDLDWYDNPPEPVRQRARDLGDDDVEVPDGRDHTPVDLGTMANFLLEATKAQQDRIETLEERVAALEDAVGGNA